jgi:hypothetical protein
MTEPPRRKRFQIHLSTAIVLMFVAGGSIWANVHERHMAMGSASVPSGGGHALWVEGVSEDEYWRVSKYLDWWGDRIGSYGFPCEALRTSTHCEITKPNDIYVTGEGNDFRKPLCVWNIGTINIDALVALALSFVVWYACEWQIHRRAARQGV